MARLGPGNRNQKNLKPIDQANDTYDGSHVPEPYKLSCTLMVPVTIGNKKTHQNNFTKFGGNLYLHLWGVPIDPSLARLVVQLLYCHNRSPKNL